MLCVRLFYYIYILRYTLLERRGLSRQCFKIVVFDMIFFLIQRETQILPFFLLLLFPQEKPLEPLPRQCIGGDEFGI